MGNSCCMASLHLVSLQATAVKILCVMVSTTWSWVQFCRKPNLTPRAKLSMWWSKSCHRIGILSTIESDKSHMDRHNFYMMTRSKRIFHIMTVPIVNASFVTCLMFFVGVLEPKRMFSTANDIYGRLIYMNAFVLCNYIFWRVPLCSFDIIYTIYIYV
jgi:hypothetical protein